MNWGGQGNTFGYHSPGERVDEGVIGEGGEKVKKRVCLCIFLRGGRLPEKGPARKLCRGENFAQKSPKGQRACQDWWLRGHVRERPEGVEAGLM